MLCRQITDRRRRSHKRFAALLVDSTDITVTLCQTSRKPLNSLQRKLDQRWDHWETIAAGLHEVLLEAHWSSWLLNVTKNGLFQQSRYAMPHSNASFTNVFIGYQHIRWCPSSYFSPRLLVHYTTQDWVNGSMSNCIIAYWRHLNVQHRRTFWQQIKSVYTFNRRTR